MTIIIKCHLDTTWANSCSQINFFPYCEVAHCRKILLYSVVRNFAAMFLSKFDWFYYKKGTGLKEKKSWKIWLKNNGFFIFRAYHQVYWFVFWNISRRLISERNDFILDQCALGKSPSHPNVDTKIEISGVMTPPLPLFSCKI